MEKIFAILFDIDHTITDNAAGSNDRAFRQGLMDIFSHAIAARFNLSNAEADDVLQDYSNSLVWWDYPDYMIDFSLNVEAVLTEVRAWHQQFLSVHEDAVAMIRELAQQEVALYVISNNPITGCLFKLERAGLASLDQPAPFRRILGTNLLRGMKHSPIVWKRAIAHLGLPPETLMTVGDDPKQDAQIPQSVGIGFSCIVNRQSGPGVKEIPGGIEVNSLDHLPSILKDRLI